MRVLKNIKHFKKYYMPSKTKKKENFRERKFLFFVLSGFNVPFYTMYISKTHVNVIPNKMYKTSDRHKPLQGVQNSNEATSQPVNTTYLVQV